MDLIGLKNTFQEFYGSNSNKIKVYFSPGRVNLMGEHTDYNGGYVFPCALNYGTYLLVREHEGEEIRFKTTNFQYEASIKPSQLEKKQGSEWVNYPLGVIDQFKKLGYGIKGLELLYSGNIPSGAGLSSSASMEMVTAFALNDFLSSNLSILDLVKLAQRSENEFIGVNCGIMDQFAVGMGQKGKAIFLNCDTLEYELVPVEIKGYKLVVTNSNKKRGLAESKYNERRSECEKALKYLGNNLRNLSEISFDKFESIRERIPGEIIYNRAKHVISENKRVLDAVYYLKNSDLHKFGELMFQSHESLKNDYEVTGNELDTLVDGAKNLDGVIGSRMTGAGFGGCTVSLVKEEFIDSFREKIGKIYQEKTGLKADFYIADIGDGTRLLEEF
ncbi:MAG: galactokinase [bacterium]